MRTSAFTKCIAFALALSGCATNRATQDVPLGFGPPKARLNYDDALRNYGASDDAPRLGMSRETYRDYVIDFYLIDIDNGYRRFKAALINEDRDTAFAGDLAVLALASFTALANTASAADDLATLTALATGTNAAIDKRLFFDRTIPAVLAAIDARRAKIKAEITVRRRMPMEQYTLGEAIADLTRLADAGNLYVGLDKITAEASAAKEDAEARLQAIVEGCSEATADSAKLNGEFIGFLREDGDRQAERVAEAAQQLDMPVNAAGYRPSEVGGVFDTKFCGDAGKRPFIDAFKSRIRTLEGG
jgi:hypothetical protein